MQTLRNTPLGKTYRREPLTLIINPLHFCLEAAYGTDTVDPSVDRRFMDCGEG